MNTKLLTVSTVLTAMLISPALLAAEATSVPIDFHGYLRGGVGVSNDGGMAQWQKKQSRSPG
ncbi:hypothetical protein OS21_00090 [Dickeya oryzae]